MTVKRIVTNIQTDDLGRAEEFYSDIFGLSLLMDHGWIKTMGAQNNAPVQINFLQHGGSDTTAPDLSIEVDNFAEVLQNVKTRKIKIEYGPADEPWGIRRFYIRDPFGKLLNISEHI